MKRASPSSVGFPMHFGVPIRRATDFSSLRLVGKMVLRRSTAWILNRMNDGGYFQEFLQDRGAWWAEEFSSGFVKDGGVLSLTMVQS